MSVLDFSDIFDIIASEKDLQWIQTNAGTIQNRDYVRAAESAPVSFKGWFMNTTTPMEKRETGTDAHDRKILRFSTERYPTIAAGIKHKDIIVFDNIRFMVDKEMYFQIETKTMHVECVEANT